MIGTAGEDAVDLTSQQLGGQGATGIKKFSFQNSEIEQIQKNPARLTKEGILKKIHQWETQSANPHTAAKYKVMLKECKNIPKSGTCVKELPDQNWSGDGRGGRAPLKEYECQILSYDKHDKQPYWVDPIREVKEKTKPSEE